MNITKGTPPKTWKVSPLELRGRGPEYDEMSKISLRRIAEVGTIAIIGPHISSETTGALKERGSLTPEAEEAVRSNLELRPHIGLLRAINQSIRLIDGVSPATNPVFVASFNNIPRPDEFKYYLNSRANIANEWPVDGKMPYLVLDKSRPGSVDFGTLDTYSWTRTVATGQIQIPLAPIMGAVIVNNLAVA